MTLTIRTQILVTPIAVLDFTTAGGGSLRIALKLEGLQRTGSVKFRSAVGMLEQLDREGPLVPGDVVIESTSGNLGLALAYLCNELELRFVAVIDPNTPNFSIRALTNCGAEIVMVDRPDSYGGYLMTRLATVQKLLERRQRSRWTDQYHNPASPAIHSVSTGPEIIAQLATSIAAVAVPVSTGGTLAGLANFFKSTAASPHVLAVDTPGSQALRPSAGTRFIPGLGSSQASAFLQLSGVDELVDVEAAEAVAMCWFLKEATGIAVGGSAGAAAAGLMQSERTVTRLINSDSCALVLCPDGGDRYEDSIYSEGWLRKKGVMTQVDQALHRLRVSYPDVRCSLPIELSRGKL